MVDKLEFHVAENEHFLMLRHVIANDHFLFSLLDPSEALIIINPSCSTELYSGC